MSERDDVATGGTGLRGDALKKLRRPRRAEAEQRARLLDGRAWEDFCRDLAAAGKAVLDFPLASAESDALRAEGFRYLLGLVRSGLYNALELAEPGAPRWIRNPDSQAKWGAENPDNQYLWARVDPRGTYRVFGERRSVYDFLLEVKEGHMQLGDDRVFAAVTCKDLHFDASGAFSVLLAPERPAGYAGDFVPLHPDGSYLQVRQYLLEWERETPASFFIERVGGAAPADLTAAAMADRLDLAGEWTLTTTRFWMEWVEQLRDAWRPGEIAAARRFVGGAPDIFYGNDWYKLADDEALIFESELPDARYWQIELCDPWFKTLEFASRQTSLNHNQARVDADGRFRCVIAHRDPGVANWLDTCGNREGMIQYRWIWTRTNPQPRVRCVKHAAIAQHLPAATVRVTPEQRRAAISVREAHVRRREPAA
ncbi:MAG: DUF1214 domain-containing protein [Deltaproteobacteria bacterium]|nr:DUF1214 domain-containing protein [Deltaproteobacteria bacterium]